MNRTQFSLVTASLFFTLAACAGPTEEVADEEDVGTTEERLSRGDPLPKFPSFAPVHIEMAGAAGCIGTSADFVSGYPAADFNDCALAATRSFTIVPVEGGHYTFRNVATDRCLDVLATSPAEGAPIVEHACHGGENQRWRAVELSAGEFRLQAVHSGKCLERQSNGLRTAACRTAETTQRFTFREGAKTYLRLPAIASNGVERCVEVAGWSHEDGAGVQQYGCHGGANQQFYPLWFPGRDGAAQGLEMRAAHSGKCLTVDGADDRNGARIVQSSCARVDHQRFSTHRGTFGVQLRPKHVDKCLARDGRRNDANGAHILLWACDDGENRQFQTVFSL